MTAGRWHISVTTPDWGQGHLSSDAIVAYVDDELASGPHLRATQHLAQCHECAAQVVAQSQARSALRTADGPSLPTSLLSSLRSIPQDTDLPAPPAGLAVTSDGQFVSVLRPECPMPELGTPQRGAGRQADAVTVAPSHGRRPPRGLRVGTGVAVSGLAIGAIAFALPTAVGVPSDAPPPARDVRGGAVSPVDARLQLPPAPQAVPPVPSVPSAAPTSAPAPTPTAGAGPLDTHGLVPGLP